MTKRREKKNVEVERRDLYVQSAYCGRLDGEDVGRKEWTTQWLAVASKMEEEQGGGPAMRRMATICRGVVEIVDFCRP